MNERMTYYTDMKHVMVHEVLLMHCIFAMIILHEPLNIPNAAIETSSD